MDDTSIRFDGPSAIGCDYGYRVFAVTTLEYDLRSIVIVKIRSVLRHFVVLFYPGLQLRDEVSQLAFLMESSTGKSAAMGFSHPVEDVGKLVPLLSIHCFPSFSSLRAKLRRPYAAVVLSDTS